ncbi:MAG: ATP-binding cassette domain-containing protein [Bacteroidaceae bacterium]|nr:ATP-binding cassette domain-containing protein [Bacteroidaceae bacterium]
MIEIQHLDFAYNGNKVLENISMQMNDGCIYGLLGENGVGKTTLLTLLCGLKKPKEGAIFVEGKDPFKRTPEQLANQYYLPDEVSPMAMKASAFANEYGRFWTGFDMDKFNEIMALLESDAEQRMDRMSNGQLKKVYIAFALACNAKYYYLDEPTNGLDIPSKALFRKALSRYTREDSVVVISTHQVRDLENMIDPIIIMDKRDVLLNATIAEIADKLYFDYSGEPVPDALYSENAPGMAVQVRANDEHVESKVNIEALFNTVHHHKELIKGMFNK